MFENQKILILGFARSGYEAAKVLIQRGNEVVLNDSKKEELQDADKIRELKELGVQFVFGSHPDDLLDSSFDYLIKNPGVPIHHKYVLQARELGIEVINELPSHKFDAAIAAVAHKAFECMDVCSLLKDKHVIFDVKCTLDRNIIDARL